MTARDTRLTFSVFDGIARIDPLAWDALIQESGDADNPFLSYGFLSSLEDSGSASPASGWQPLHLLGHDPAGRLRAALPLYLKSHSYGEYIFDWGWAEAYERAGGRYYPKLLSAIPFTPVPGPRLLLADPSYQADLLAALGELAEDLQVSSAHLLFTREQEWSSLQEEGFLPRLSLQYHWFNRGYGSYDDFLAGLSSRKRKNLKKERATAQAQGLDLRLLEGREITKAQWDGFYHCYSALSKRKMGQVYLSRDFFALLAERLGARLLLAAAFDGKELVAGALHFIGGKVLYGRSWGSLYPRQSLHFELCYHMALDYAIVKGFTRVEGGVQGRHKVLRGYEPVATYSLHRLYDPGFAQAVGRFLAAERQAVQEEIAAGRTRLPYQRAEN